MSLQAAAQHLAAHGRGRDSQLVHMSPREVKSLQDLAKAHGGTLTTNPNTGLPEAGFLEAVLPAAVGFGLNAAFPGLGALGSAAVMGGLSYAATGSLTKGLMAGLGAYGGANLGAGVTPEMMGAGTSEAPGNLINAPTPASVPVSETIARPVQQAALVRPEYVDVTTGAATSPVAEGAVQATQLGALPPAQLPPTVTQTPGIDYMDSNAGMAEAYNNAANVAPSAGKNLAYNPDFGYGGARDVSLGGAGNATTTAANMTTTPQPSLWDTVKKNASLKNIGMAAAPLIGEALQPKPLAPINTASAANPVYRYNRGTANPMPAPDPYGIEQSYFPTAGYTRVAAKGGVMRMAEGGPAIQGIPSHGPVEQMSIANSIGQNTGFPQAAINRGAYATPWQTPISRNMLEGAADTGVNPITGSMNFAEGGDTKLPPTYGVQGTDVHPYLTSGGAAAPAAPASSSGSPTGSVIGDLGFAIANQGISPISAALAQGLMDAFSTISPVSVNAVNGMDAASDAAAAATSGGFGSETGPGGIGEDTGGGPGPGPSGGDGAGGGDGAAEARGGLSPHFKYHMATGGISDAYRNAGGHFNLGSYSDGGRLLRGPGDGVSDSIPAVIGRKQPARLADGEFVVPARIVSEIGNGSTEAGARKLYAMMDRVQQARGKTVGKGKVAKNTRAEKYLPA